MFVKRHKTYKNQTTIHITHTHTRTNMHKHISYKSLYHVYPMIFYPIMSPHLPFSVIHSFHSPILCRCLFIVKKETIVEISISLYLNAKYFSSLSVLLILKFLDFLLMKHNCQTKVDQSKGFVISDYF